MPLTVDQLQAQLDSLNAELGSATAEVRGADGRSIRKRSIDEILKAKAAVEDMIREASGSTGSRVSFAQHKRGDGPDGPTGRW